MLRLFSLALLISSLHAEWVSCPARENEYDADVLILGAGVAGISAAKSLHEGGVDNFLILEARDRIGGRMHSAEFGGIRVELGEQWIHGIHLHEDPPKRLTGHNDLQKLVKRCGLQGFVPLFKSKSFHMGAKLVSNATLEKLSYVYRNVSLDILMQSIWMQKRGLPDISVRQALTQNGWIPNSQLYKLLEWDFFNFLYIQDPDTASLFRTYPDKIWDDLGEDFFIITDQRGSEHLLHCLASDFDLATNDDPRLKLDTRVLRVRNGDSCVCVDTVSGRQRKTYCAKYALVTFSIGVLQSQRVVRFSPPLPRWKREVLSKFSMGNLIRVFLKFNKPFWDDVTFIDRVDKIKGRYPAFQPLDHFRYNISLSDPVHVIAWSITDKQADIVGSQPVEKTKRDVMEVLREMYPDAAISEPEDILVTNWRDNPLYLGACINKPIGATDQLYEKLAAPVGRIFFSGEATHKDYSGLIHGAYYSGTEVGKTLANMIAAAD